MFESKKVRDLVSSAACTGQAILQLCSSYFLSLIWACEDKGIVCCQTFLLWQLGRFGLSAGKRQLC